MSKVKIEIAKLGNINTWIDLGKVRRWKSALFEVMSDINQHRLPTRSEGSSWEFLDSQVSDTIPTNTNGDFLMVLTDCPLEDNYYMRRLSGNRVCITLYQVKDILSSENIPVENFILKSIYEALIYYKVALNHGGELPKSEISYTHDETKGCLFDMTGNKSEITVSCRAPKLCDTCYSDFSRSKVPTNFLDSIRKELKKIGTPIYYRLLAFVKRRPILSIIITGFTAIILNIISNLIISIFQ